MAEYDTTRFVNIDDEKFTAYFNRSKEPNGYTFEAGETRTLVKFMAETFASHLVDKVLQKQGVKDTKRDTPLRRSLLSKVLPDLSSENSAVKTMDAAEEVKALKEQLERERSEREKMGERLSRLENEKPAEAPKKKGGRPKKVKTEEVPQPAVATV